MSPDLATDIETIRIFNSIDKSRIDQDLDDALDDFEAVHERVRENFEIKGSERTPAIHAELLHNELVRAYAVVKSPMEENIGLHLATLAAGEVMQMTSGIAFSSRNLAKTEQELLEMRRAAGIDDQEDEDAWEGKQKPADYDRLLEESTDLLHKIEQMTFTDVLRRYRLHALADYYEKSPDEFYAASRAGHRAFFGDLKII